MKNLALILAFIIMCLTTFSQSVDSVNYKNKTYNVGDTITLLSGAGNNGEFLSTTSTVNIIVGGVSSHLTSIVAGMSYIIKKIKVYKAGTLKEKIYLYFNSYIGDTSIDLKQALILKEIL